MLNLIPKGRLMCPKRRKNVKQKCISESLNLAAMFFDAAWQATLVGMFCTTYKKTFSQHHYDTVWSILEGNIKVSSIKLCSSQSVNIGFHCPKKYIDK